VLALFETLPPHERARITDPEILRQVTVGSLKRLRAPSASATGESEREFTASVVQQFVDACRRRNEMPRELFRTLLDWSDELERASRLSDAREVCALASSLGVHAFPDIWPWIQLRRARLQELSGALDDAHDTLLGTCRRLDRIADRNAVPALLGALGSISLQTGRAHRFTQLIADRMRAFHTNVDERRAVVGLMRRMHGGGLRLLAGRDVAAADKLLWLTHAACLGAAARIGWRPVSRVLERCSTAAAYVRQYGLGPGSRPAGSGAAAPESIDATLVTRAMGGLGDFLMMTPGLHALRLRQPGRPVVLALPRRFFPIFDGNDDVQVMDIDDDVDPSAYREWFNLTDCPAARAESRAAPAIRTNRIELFARGLGITGRRLTSMNRRPRYTVSDAERAWRDQFFADRGLGRGPIVGVQARTDEIYRDPPHMRAIIEALCREARVVVFGSPAIGDIDGLDVIRIHGLDLRRAFAIASGCDALVTPDSAFFHLAGALDLPCVGLFGPTDGRLRGQDYPQAVTLDARRTLRCIPCWRNETTPCGLTGLRPSACLGEIDPDEVVRAVRACCTKAPRQHAAAV
jgi:ADP-heptose:LPS heptosyltransferase